MALRWGGRVQESLYLKMVCGAFSLQLARSIKSSSAWSRAMRLQSKAGGGKTCVFGPLRALQRRASMSRHILLRSRSCIRYANAAPH